MTLRVPIGEPEGAALEFKGSRALDDPRCISREVVAMLNSGREGRVWIGISDRDGRASGIEPIENAGARKDRLRDHFVDAIEPSPTDDEVATDVVPSGDSELLAVRVAPRSQRGPYALLRKGGRQYLTRVGARVRAMSREEIAAVFREASETEPRENRAARRALDALRERMSRAGETSGSAWMSVRPIEDLELELERDEVKGWTEPKMSGTPCK